MFFAIKSYCWEINYKCPTFSSIWINNMSPCHSKTVQQHKLLVCRSQSERLALNRLRIQLLFVAQQHRVQCFTEGSFPLVSSLFSFEWSREMLQPSESIHTGLKTFISSWQFALKVNQHFQTAALTRKGQFYVL